MERLEIEITGSLTGLEKAINEANSRLKKFGDSAKQLGESFSKYLTLPIVGLGAASLKSFGSIQSLKNGLTAVTGSAEKAGEQFTRLQKLAQLPGLGLQEVAKGAINLQVIGFSAEKAEKSMSAFGNAVATVGKGREEFERAIYGLSQLANTDFPLGEDLNILKDAIPQVTPLLKEAFGTARSDELTKLGITSAQVVDTIVNGLSKLPPVTGGINGAFENMSDGVTTNLAKVGDSIDQAFDVASIVNKLINSLSGITDAFVALSPETRKIIIIIAGLAAAIGPLLFIIGTFSTTVLPGLITGFGLASTAIAAITGPILLIGAAVAGAVYLIIKHWDEIVKYFTTGSGTGVFTELKNAFFASIEFIQSIWRAFTLILQDFWDAWGSKIIATTKYIFNLISTVLKTAFSAIAAVFNIFTKVINKDWDGAGRALLDLTKKVWNGILSIIVDVIKAGGNLVSKFFDFIGLEGVADKFENISSVIADLIGKKFSFDIPITATVKTNDKVLGQVFAADKPEQEKPTTTTPKKAGKTTPNILQDTKKDSLVQDYLKSLNIDKRFKVAIPKIDLDLPTPTVLELGNLVSVQQAELDLKIAKMEDSFATLSQSILTSGVGDAFATVGASIGESIASGGNVIQALGSGLLGVVGNIATQLGKAAIGIGIAMKAIKLSFKNPLTAIAAGVALIAIGAFISSKVAGMTNPGGGSNQSGPSIPAFANGGIVSGPTTALVGEYPGAKSNPEVIAPLNKLKGMLGRDNNDVQVFIPEARIGNDAIYLAYEKGKKSQNRF